MSGVQIAWDHDLRQALSTSEDSDSRMWAQLLDNHHDAQSPQGLSRTVMPARVRLRGHEGHYVVRVMRAALCIQRFWRRSQFDRRVVWCTEEFSCFAIQRMLRCSLARSFAARARNVARVRSKYDIETRRYVRPLPREVVANQLDDISPWQALLCAEKLELRYRLEAARLQSLLAEQASAERNFAVSDDQLPPQRMCKFVN